MITNKQFDQLSSTLEGELHYDIILRTLYATDASAYREMPLAVALPKTKEDIQKIIAFASQHKATIIPRAAGTSLAGQVVGKGIIVDISKYLNKIIEFNKEERWVRVQPGVNLSELNLFLEPHGLLFGPETSTANRCLIGGMLGNNACGLHSLVYGSTRDHTLSVEAILSDGSTVSFENLSKAEFDAKCNGNTLENKIYQNINNILSDIENQQNIRREYPHPSLERRNTGYAIDLLLESEPFTNTTEKFNFCKLIAGSEGTLAFITEIKLNLVPLAPPEKGLVCAHFKNIEESLHGNLIALKYKPLAIELMDDKIIELTKGNIGLQNNRFFIQGDPGALLFIEFAKNTKEELEEVRNALEKELREAQLGYHYPIVYGADIKKVWALRTAGLGVLSNMPGDAKPVSVIEDTAVAPDKLPAYIKDFDQLLEKYKLQCVYHAHIATGELHLRPILNLKDPKDVEMFHTIAYEVAKLVKKYNGSLSGEHGDGRLRGEFIPLMIGEKNYDLLKQIKHCWDSNNVFNANKIIDTPAMNTHLRFEPGQKTKEIDTIFDFSNTLGIVRASEKCNGSGDCRKSSIIGGTMCPSFMATRDENKTTRSRANILREYLTHSPKNNPFNHKEIYEVMDLCLSCKACKSECPSNVDVAKLKAEFLQHYYDANGVPLRSFLIANITTINKLGRIAPWLFNFAMGNKSISGFFMKIFGFAPQRQMPLLNKHTLKQLAHQYSKEISPEKPIGTVYFFNDEFTNFNDSDIGIKAVRLLSKLGYKVIIPNHIESGRTFLSKGLVRKSQKIAIKNINLLKDIITDETPLIGIEPSTILAFRDEYPDLVRGKLKDAANKLAKQSFMVDEFLAQQIDKGVLKQDMFTTDKKHIKLHGHCQQKAVASTMATKKLLSFPLNYSVEEIPSGCCGMAGSFGYEKEKYELSMKIGEMVLFPAVRNTSAEILISAPGTSCRHQIKDGTGRDVLHPVEIIYDAMVK